MRTTKTAPIKIVRRPEVLERFGYGKTCLHSRVKSGLVPAPCQLGGRSVGWIDHEIDVVISALAAGQTDEEIKALVKLLVARRAERAELLRGLFA